MTHKPSPAETPAKPKDPAPTPQTPGNAADATFVTQHVMSVARALRPRAYSNTVYVNGLPT